MRARLLLLETASAWRDRIASHLEQWGHLVEVANGHEVATTLLQTNDFEVILAETATEHERGIELIAAARRCCPQTPVIAFAPDSAVDDVLDTIREGAFDFVMLDGQLSALRSALQRALEHVRLTRENARLLSDLQQANAMLEERVQQRTRQLEEANLRLTAEHGELERTVAALSETQGQLVQAEKMASLGLLTAGVAHEINNPLGFVLPNFSVLEQWCDRLCEHRGHPDASSAREMLDVLKECREGILRIRDIVRELGLFSRRTPTRNDKVDLARVIASVCRLFGGQLRYRALLRQEVAPVPAARADAGQLRQVVLNLLINAAHAIAEDAPDGQIVVRTRHEGEHVAIEVRDNGAGIPAEILDKVYDPFFTTKPVGKGTGMGLSISRQLIDGMDGSLHLESTVGQGTTVTIRLGIWSPSDQLQAE